MYVVSIHNNTRSMIMLLGVNRREGRVEGRARVSVSLSDAEWATAKPGLDALTLAGDVTYTVVRDGLGVIQTVIDLGEDASDADLQQDFTLANALPVGCVILSASVQIVEEADGPAHSAVTAELLVGALALFTAPLDIFADTADVGDGLAADANTNLPLLTESTPILRVISVDDAVGDLTQGKMRCTIIYFNPALAA